MSIYFYFMIYTILYIYPQIFVKKNNIIQKIVSKTSFCYSNLSNVSFIS